MQTIELTNQEILRSQIPENKLAVNEIFLSIQGEGRYSGVRMIFLRLNLCRVNCNFCDTKYTWHCITQNQFMTIDEIIEQIKKISIKCKFVCITGGEPLEQVAMLINLCKALKIANYLVHLETSGTIIIPDELGEYCHWITCSPKKFNGANFKSVITEVKILVTEKTELTKLKSWLKNFTKKVWVVIQPIEPHDDRMDSIDRWGKNKARAVQIVLETGWSLSAQIHKYFNVR